MFGLQRSELRVRDHNEETALVGVVALVEEDRDGLLALQLEPMTGHIRACTSRW